MTEADLHAVVVQAINEVCAKQELYLPQLKANIEKMLGDDNSGPVAELNRQIGELEQQILQRTRAKQDCDDLGQEVLRLRDEKYQLQLEDATKESARQKIAELELYMNSILMRSKMDVRNRWKARWRMDPITGWSRQYGGLIYSQKGMGMNQCH